MDTHRVTITDVAREAGTSTATVSNYLNGKHEKLSQKTRERIERIIRETGYIPNAQAQTLSGKATHVIAILILDNSNNWAGRLLAGVERVARENSYQTIVCTTNFDPEIELMYVDKMLALGVDGFIVQPTHNFRAVNERITKAGRPVVFYDRSFYNLDSTWIKTNLYDGVYAATTACIDAGYEDFLTVAADMTKMNTRMERFQGFADALAARGLFHRAISIEHDAPSVAELTEYFKFKLNPALRTLVFVQNQWALGRVFKALQPMAHLIPERIGLIGINCTDWTDLTSPTISTVVEPVEREGRHACQMLLDLLGDEPPAAHQEILECRLNWLGSTSVTA
ncbi:MAG: substrate-binding domain-containing protein [Atopobiaceae bacterium]|nr:substrate-binding domain-containing protein [Atopobiaceae bacterium]